MKKKEEDWGLLKRKEGLVESFFICLGREVPYYLVVIREVWNILLARFLFGLSMISLVD